MPPSSVHLAMSFLAIEWLDRCRTCRCLILSAAFAVRGAAQAAFLDAQAEKRSGSLSRARADELAPGAP